jgi:uncharacterized small protein (DUF1192 family)
MVEQNVLAGDKAVLEQIISDLKEHSDKKERLVKMTDSTKELVKNVDVAEKAVQDEIGSRVKDSTNAICEGYDKSIAGYMVKLKEAQSDRDKAKMAGVKERIANETVSLKRENEKLSLQIKEEFKAAKIPMYCNSRLYLALFHTKGIGDVLIYLLSLLLLYLAAPVGMYFIPDFPTWGFIVFYFVVVVLEMSVYKYIFEKTLVHHADTIDAARKVKTEINSNSRKIKRIQKNIKNDKNETMYNLGDFDSKINSLNAEISRIQAQKATALDEFEKTTKTDIIAEIDGRERDKINAMKADLKKRTEECGKLEALVNEQRIYISSNYEAYLGKEFVTAEKLQELYALMKSGAAGTVAQAIAVYKEKH